MSEETPHQPPALPELTDRQRAFVDFYLGECNLNATAAARKLDLPFPKQEGHRLKNHPAVRAHIDAHLDDLTLTSREVLARLSLQATGSIEDVVEFNVIRAVPSGRGTRRVKKDWWPDFQKARESGAIALIKKLGYDKNGNPTLELYSAQEALALMGKYHRLFTEKVEHSGEVGLKLEDLLGSLDPGDRAALRGALADLLRRSGGGEGPGPGGGP